MPKYRRREQIVSAWQFDVNGIWPDTVIKDRGQYYVGTKSGPIKIDHGDWIITHADGLRLRIKPAIFEKMYLQMEE